MNISLIIEDIARKSVINYLQFRLVIVERENVGDEGTCLDVVWVVYEIELAGYCHFFPVSYVLRARWVRIVLSILENYIDDIGIAKG